MYQGFEGFMLGRIGADRTSRVDLYSVFQHVYIRLTVQAGKMGSTGACSGWRRDIGVRWKEAPAGCSRNLIKNPRSSVVKGFEGLNKKWEPGGKVWEEGNKCSHLHICFWMILIKFVLFWMILIKNQVIE